MKRYSFFTVILLLVFLASPVAASDFGRYWSGFTTFWGNLFGSAGGVVGIALITGVVAIFIITRGKWLK